MLRLSGRPAGASRPPSGQGGDSGDFGSGSHRPPAACRLLADARDHRIYGALRTGAGRHMNISELKGESVAFFASGGLDSCTVTHWMASHDVKVICFPADLGQPDETEGLDVVAERMKDCGAVEAVIVPLRTEMGEAGIQAIQGLTRYEGRYWNTTPL